MANQPTTNIKELIVKVFNITENVTLISKSNNNNVAVFIKFFSCTNHELNALMDVLQVIYSSQFSQIMWNSIHISLAKEL